MIKQPGVAKYWLERQRYRDSHPYPDIKDVAYALARAVLAHIAAHVEMIDALEILQKMLAESVKRMFASDEAVDANITDDTIAPIQPVHRPAMYLM